MTYGAQSLCAHTTCMLDRTSGSKMSLSLKAVMKGKNFFLGEYFRPNSLKNKKRSFFCAHVLKIEFGTFAFDFRSVNRFCFFCKFSLQDVLTEATDFINSDKESSKGADASILNNKKGKNIYCKRL